MLSPTPPPHNKPPFPPFFYFFGHKRHGVFAWNSPQNHCISPAPSPIKCSRLISYFCHFYLNACAPLPWYFPYTMRFSVKNHFTSFNFKKMVPPMCLPHYQCMVPYRAIYIFSPGSIDLPKLDRWSTRFGLSVHQSNFVSTFVRPFVLPHVSPKD